jgi:hypothetical protein
MNLAFIILTALFAFAKADQTVGWYRGAVWSGSPNSNGAWQTSGLWASRRNWKTGKYWNINSIWNSSTKGITYAILSNMSDWHLLPNKLNVTYTQVSNCSTWKAFKNSFKKKYNSNKTEELLRFV